MQNKYAADQRTTSLAKKLQRKLYLNRVQNKHELFKQLAKMRVQDRQDQWLVETTIGMNKNCAKSMNEYLREGTYRASERGEVKLRERSRNKELGGGTF